MYGLKWLELLRPTRRSPLGGQEKDDVSGINSFGHLTGSFPRSSRHRRGNWPGASARGAAVVLGARRAPRCPGEQRRSRAEMLEVDVTIRPARQA